MEASHYHRHMWCCHYYLVVSIVMMMMWILLLLSTLNVYSCRLRSLLLYHNLAWLHLLHIRRIHEHYLLRCITLRWILIVLLLVRHLLLNIRVRRLLLVHRLILIINRFFTELRLLLLVFDKRALGVLACLINYLIVIVLIWIHLKI